MNAQDNEKIADAYKAVIDRIADVLQVSGHLRQDENIGLAVERLVAKPTGGRWVFFNQERPKESRPYRIVSLQVPQETEGFWCGQFPNGFWEDAPIDSVFMWLDAPVTDEMKKGWGIK